MPSSMIRVIFLYSLHIVTAVGCIFSLYLYSYIQCYFIFRHD